ncbi:MULTISPECIES: sporulation protein [unclassified Candidatus Frackibacter]|uniref:sporulation protein n=1 Tax=unclassified Candidatus Frackibacter TaxID=2648818 RepID=UPI00087EB82E|nr:MULTISPECIES: sporulation protein [unclassified Candidatus Frackibacter]SDC84744.1 sporulation-control protein [Candidatus Frackibacter sp. WG11]SEM99181.1 sporulation-control protein [Candidatus Frackibacter sp. WG12]SFM07146.1 sporulation-control protein [Candidatus Frackibacter sp. WG13]
MGLFNKVMASIGIGAARVDTILDEIDVRPGDELTGKVKILGGNVEQRIDDLYLYIMTKYEKEVDDKKVNINEKIQLVNIPVSKDIQPQEEIEIPFSFILNEKTPISSSKSPVWIHTGLDIKKAIDPKDNDGLQVKPHPYLQIVMEALDELGFKIRKIKNEYSHLSRKFSFMQELELRPTREFRNELDELEILYSIHDNYLELIIEIDRKAKGLAGIFAEAIDIDETKGRLQITKEELNKGVDYTTATIRDAIKNNI